MINKEKAKTNTREHVDILFTVTITNHTVLLAFCQGRNLSRLGSAHSCRKINALNWTQKTRQPFYWGISNITHFFVSVTPHNITSGFELLSVDGQPQVLGTEKKLYDTYLVNISNKHCKTVDKNVFPLQYRVRKTGYFEVWVIGDSDIVASVELLFWESKTLNRSIGTKLLSKLPSE